MMWSPHIRAIQLATHRNGPKGIGRRRSRPKKAMNTIPMTAPRNDDNKIISGSCCQPSQAPSAANSLKSPKPMPSLPVASRKAWYTSHSEL